jgi:multidrug resistance efflux pump
LRPSQAARLAASQQVAQAAQAPSSALPARSAPAAAVPSAAVPTRSAPSTAPKGKSPVASASWLRHLAMAFGATSLGVMCAAVAVSNVEVSARASGTLRLPNGVRPVSSLIAGSVTDVFVRPGDLVEEGEAVVRLEAAELGQGLIKRQRDLTSLEQDTLEAEAAEREFVVRARSALMERRSALGRRIELGGASHTSRACASPLAVCSLPEDGPRPEPADNIAALRAELALVDLEIADRSFDWQARERERRNALSRAEAGVADVEDLLDSVVLRAVVSGRVESLSVAPGDVVAAGAVLAQLVPVDAPRTVEVFLPASDLGLVAPEDEALLELSSLPSGEGSSVPARVSYVTPELATPQELDSELGEHPRGEFVRVELELLDDATHAHLAQYLRSGARIVAHFPPREKQIAQVVADAATSWFD